MTPAKIAAILAEDDANKPSEPLPPVDLPPEHIERLMPKGLAFDRVLISSFDGLPAADVMYALTASLADVRAFDSKINDQGSRPTCTAFASMAILENLLNQAGEQHDLSEEAFWSAVGGKPSSSLPQVKLRQLLVPPEASWPYNGQSQDGSGIARATDVRPIGGASVVRALQAKHPVYMIVDTNSSWYGNETGIIKTHAAAVSGEHSSHAVALVAATSNYLVVKNSWGSQWGDGGYGYLSYNYCSEWSCSFWEVSGVAKTVGGGDVGDVISGTLSFRDFVGARFRGEGGRTLWLDPERRCSTRGTTGNIRKCSWEFLNPDQIVVTFNDDDSLRFYQARSRNSICYMGDTAPGITCAGEMVRQAPSN